MRAALIEALAGAPRVTEVPDPSPGPGQALIRVEAAGLNPVDVSVASGRHYSRVPDPPYVPGIEGAGRVLQGQRLPPGARVRFETGPASGSLAELAAVDEDRCLQVELDAPTAAGFGVAGSAAWLALHQRAALRPGERVLVLGATGVVGNLAVQLAKLADAGRVVAAGRDPQRLQAALTAGADVTVSLDSRPPEEMAAALSDAAQGGFDVVFDPVWGAPLEAALLACAPEARIVNLGQSAGPHARLPSNVIRGRQLRLVGHANQATSWELRLQALQQVAGLLAQGQLHLDVEQVPLDRVAEAWARLRSSPHVKLVAVPGG